jgi:quinolinate synthase
VKAESDICCTSSNALKVVESFGTDRVLCIPDEYLAQNIAKQTKVKVIAWKGHCEVHERFSAEELRRYRAQNPGVVILAHPECPPDVLTEADYAGSTSGMIAYVGTHRPRRVVMVTECSMSDNVAVQHPEVEFIKPCNLCPHMKRITLPKVLDALQHMRHCVEVDPQVAARDRRAVERMLDPTSLRAELAA